MNRLVFIIENAMISLPYLEGVLINIEYIYINKTR